LGQPFTRLDKSFIQPGKWLTDVRDLRQITKKAFNFYWRERFY
jgi:hypothetical protein